MLYASEDAETALRETVDQPGVYTVGDHLGRKLGLARAHPPLLHQGDRDNRARSSSGNRAGPSDGCAR